MPPPTLTAIDPTSYAGSTLFTMTCTGTNFDDGAIVTVGGNDMPTAFFNATDVVARVIVSLLTPSGDLPVTVRNVNGQTTTPLTLAYDATPPPGTQSPLIPLDVAKIQLRITDTDHDADVLLKTRQAEAILLDYLKPLRSGEARPDWPWTMETVPRPVQAAILVMLTHLYEHRGDDMSPSASGTTPDADVWQAVERLTIRFRDPAIA